MSKKIIFKKKVVDVNGRLQTVIKPMNYYVTDEQLKKQKSIDTKYGSIAIEKLNNTGKIKTESNKDVYVFNETFIDKYQRMNKLAQTIPLKDIGYIITFTGLNKNSVVGEAGCGSGGVSCFLANFVKEIMSYDINDSHIEVTRSNAKFLDLNNLTVLKKDIYSEEIDVNDEFFDLFILDLPDPEKAIFKIISKLKIGGFIVSYSPSINQNYDLVNALTKNELDNLEIIKTVEVVVRNWDIRLGVSKPDELEITHSGFLSFFRRVC